MLQLQVIRKQKDLVLERLAHKNFSEPHLVEEIIGLDDKRRGILTANEQLLAKRNAASKEIGALMAQGKKEEAEAKKQEVAAMKSEIEKLEAELAEVDVLLHDTLVKLPNLPSALVPKGKAAEDNEVVKEAGIKPNLQEGSVPHWDLITKYDIVDFATGVKIAGSGFPLFKGKGAKLQRALVAYFLDFNTAAGYTEFIPPYMVNEASAYGTGQLPDKEGQMYYMPADNFYLIPTAEVPVTNIFRDEILKESDLPIKMTAHSPCFRREAGSFGKDVRGLNRVHQFEKVEIVQLVHPDKSYEVLDEMVAHVEKLVASLGLPYRILRLCGGDMSFASALTYDFEVYSAAQEKWLEVSSVSNFEAFQTNRMKIRYKDGDSKIQLLHSLNGSSMALPRIMAAILENNQTTDGIIIPEVLRPYFGSDRLN
ncbi:MAG: serine--tRNA ligase [Sphingobacteriales bacterium]|jgi:seryl-tRNA synthetase